MKQSKNKEGERKESWVVKRVPVEFVGTVSRRQGASTTDWVAPTDHSLKIAKPFGSEGKGWARARHPVEKVEGYGALLGSGARRSEHPHMNIDY